MSDLRRQQLVRDPIVDNLIRFALEEDFGDLGDVTSKVTPETTRAEAVLKTKSPGVISGLGVAREVWRRVDASMKVETLVEDGALVEPGVEIMRMSGWARSILAGERTVLNFLQKMSGMATLTHRFVELVAGTSAKILDTRKTPPGWRALCKYAVACGGGENHRTGLYDMILIKDNHLATLGGEESVAEAIAIARDVRPIPMLIEAEVTRLDTALMATEAQADIILLDNMSPEEMARTVKAIRDHAKDKGLKTPLIEASGGINLKTVRSYAETGVDRISVGALTHSAPALDISLDMTPVRRY